MSQLYQYNINNNGSYEDDWDFPIFSFVKLTAEEFTAVVEKAHDAILAQRGEECWVDPIKIANTIVEIDDRFFHSDICLTAVVDGWKHKDDWDEKFKGVFP